MGWAAQGEVRHQGSCATWSGAFNVCNEAGATVQHTCSRRNASRPLLLLHQPGSCLGMEASGGPRWQGSECMPACVGAGASAARANDSAIMRHTLLDLALHVQGAGFPEVRDSKHSVTAIKGAAQGGGVLQSGVGENLLQHCRLCGQRTRERLRRRCLHRGSPPTTSHPFKNTSKSAFLTSTPGAASALLATLSGLRVSTRITAPSFSSCRACSTLPPC